MWKKVILLNILPYNPLSIHNHNHLGMEREIHIIWFVIWWMGLLEGIWEALCPSRIPASKETGWPLSATTDLAWFNSWSNPGTRTCKNLHLNKLLFAGLSYSSAKLWAMTMNEFAYFWHCKSVTESINKQVLSCKDFSRHIRGFMQYPFKNFALWLLDLLRIKRLYLKKEKTRLVFIPEPGFVSTYLSGKK